MTPKERAAMQQALEALSESSGLVSEYKGCHLRLIKAITAMREALAEPTVKESLIVQDHIPDATKMVTLTTEQAQQIEEALVTAYCWRAVEIIRAARTQADHSGEFTEMVAEQAEQEPVAVVKENPFCSGRSDEITVYLPVGTKLYTSLVRTKDLTDEELFSIANKVGFDGDLMKMNHASSMPSIAEQYARAVIAADREKNK